MTAEVGKNSSVLGEELENDITWNNGLNWKCNIEAVYMKGQNRTGFKVCSTMFIFYKSVVDGASSSQVNFIINAAYVQDKQRV